MKNYLGLFIGISLRIFCKICGIKRKGFFPGRFNPTHKGHVATIKWLLLIFDELVIGIGSCYNAGTSRHPLLAQVREKMLAQSLLHEGIDLSRITFVHIPDYDDWDSWWNDIAKIIKDFGITHFITGNKKEISDKIQQNKIKGFRIINPEKEIPACFYFDFHATDLRQAIADNDYETFAKIADFGTLQLMGTIDGFRAICDALDNKGINFISGRQTVDTIVSYENKEGIFLLCGKRKSNKANFPGYYGLPGGGISLFENPLDAALRELKEETDLGVELCDRILEPAIVKIYGHIYTMRFVRLFSTDNPRMGGNEGGSSQVFHINLGELKNPEEYEFKSLSDLEDVKFRLVTEELIGQLAYQQGDMVREALGIDKTLKPIFGNVIGNFTGNNKQ